jgi:hypothetical protein
VRAAAYPLVAFDSVCSFARKAVLVAVYFFGGLSGGSSLIFSTSTLLVEALPSLLTIVLMIRYHSGSNVVASGSGSDIGVSLLHRASACDHIFVSDAATQESRDLGNVAGVHRHVSTSGL